MLNTAISVAEEVGINREGDV